MKNKYFYGLPRWLTFLLLLMAARHLPAQKHDYNWVYGYSNKIGDPYSEFGGGVIDFNKNPPLLYKKNLGMDFSLFGVSCSDSSGNLLFYSNGLRIYNHKNKLMQFGDTINPGKLWEKYKTYDYPNAFGGQCIPAPGKPDCYYFFHHGSEFVGNTNIVKNSPLYYSLIDMSANNGEGRVLEKNRILLTGDLIRLSLVKHGNGRDWWLLIAQNSENRYYRFLISATGISGPEQQVVGDVFIGLEGPSTCLFSPDGTRYIRPDVNKGIYLFDFNRCTGELSNYYLMPAKSGRFIVGFCEFSPDSRFLYVNKSGMVVKLDLHAPNFGYYAIDTIQRFDYYYYPFSLFPVGFDFPKLAPDNKIYYGASSTTRWMHVVHRPNLPGSACDMENHGLLLPRYNSFTICPAPNYRLGVWEGSPCDTMGRHPADGGFQKTSYEAFLERQAKGLPPPIEASHPQPPPMPPISNDRLEHRINVSKSTFSDHEK